MPLCEGTLDFCDREIQLLEPNLVNIGLQARTWMSSKGIIGTTGQARSFKFLFAYCLEEWLTNDVSFKSALSKLAGANPSAEIQEQFYSIYLLLGIMKGEASFFLQNKLYRDE